MPKTESFRDKAVRGAIKAVSISNRTKSPVITQGPLRRGETIPPSKNFDNTGTGRKKGEG